MNEFALDQTSSGRHDARNSELPPLNSQRTLVSRVEDQDVNPFAVSFVEPDQTGEEVLLFDSPRNQDDQDQDGEVISSVALTVVRTPLRDSLEHNSGSKLENEESANFSLTPCNKDDDYDESSNDDVDEDGSLILGRSSEQIRSDSRL